MREPAMNSSKIEQFLKEQNEDVIKRFESRFVKTDTCWLWNRKVISEKNRGSFYLKGKCYGASRMAYMLYVGPIPDGLFVCHTCDVGACVNPDHLFLGTHSDNMKDCARKGRSVFQTRKLAKHNLTKTHCPKSHPYSGENLIVYKHNRQCKICQRRNGRKRDLKKDERFRRLIYEQFRWLFKKQKCEELLGD